MGTRLGLQCPAGIRSTKWVSDDALELARRLSCHQSRPVTGCAVSTVKKGDPLRYFSPPSLPPPRATASGNSRVARGRVSSRPHPQWAARSRAPPRPRPETLEAAPAIKGVDAGVGNINNHDTPPQPPTKAPAAKQAVHPSQRSPSPRGKLLIRRRFGYSLRTAAAATAAVRRPGAPLPSSARPRPPLTPTPFASSLLPSRGPRTHTPGDTLRTWLLTLRLNPSRQGTVAKAARGVCVRGPGKEAKWG